ncbi:TauD/TfdA dioxygenase family protein [Glaciimonas immobilis]|uniref:Taurine dioxygenase n=1 Tax=Glaciimonas immobilis TaxID=728004 RepID=A0A840RTD0_9BURK|nr:TauD/TfdA family dioxygenase [Glaciimonas immobilis]KAF3997014.1 TauD/TfdA family dioxygenase [Glaciimonas immobilis]MBB5199851.1 taurine dioxygenase [Glaciimonas immobilis]
MKFVESGKSLGARVDGIDLSQALSDEQFKVLEQALGKYGVLSYPDQSLTSLQLKNFAERFGRLEINVANAYQEPGLPEVMILSNKVDAQGKPLGLSDAGQDWHTDMSYSNMIAFTNVLYGVEIPHRNGEPLGNTEFCNMHAAYDDLPEELKARLGGMTVTHDFAKFWDKMRREKGSSRPPLTDAQRKAKPPVSHPIFLKHPITGKNVLYANPGYSMRINELPQDESDRVLAFLFEHQLQSKYQYRHRWSVGDVLMWDNMGTLHNAVPDYGRDEHRYIKRCQVIANRYFEDAKA